MRLLGSTFTSVHGLGESVARLFDARVESLDCVVWGAILLEVTCGMLGSLVVLRRQSLLGDAIGHSVLPGVCLGFLVAGGRSMPFLLAGALLAGLLAAGLITAIQRTTNLKSGECMGLVFTGFYGLGIVFYKHILSGQHAGQSGLDKFLFGQIAGISLGDVAYMALAAAASLVVVIAAWRSLSVWAFDEEFAHGLGINVRLLHLLLTALLTVAIVISIQAVGVVLVSAMLVTPAAAAYLLTDRLHRMVLLSAAFGAGAGLAGAFFSLLWSDAPTGAFMVLGASAIFAVVFHVAPRHGVLPRLMRLWRRRRRTAAENLLRTMYLILEKRGGDDRRFGVAELAAQRQESPAQVRRTARIAAGSGWLDSAATDPLVLNDTGLAEAKRIVRNHRLWELFLTQEAKLAPDRVHADAEYIEHVLPRDVLRKLEEMLQQTGTDPHGKPIP